MDYGAHRCKADKNQRSDVPAGERFRYEVRLVSGVQLVPKVFHVSFNGPRSDPELLRALLGRKAPCNALQHLAFSFREGDEIFLLPRNIHH